MTEFDMNDMRVEMGICPECRDHMPCGCNNEWNEAYENEPDSESGKLDAM